MATVTLDPEAIEQLSGERKTLLDTIDNLRKHGIGRFVDLPQIIVVGDQSSGKSSVLEAISRVRFPVKEGVCTRFATELVLRTDPQTRIDVKVQPAAASGDVLYTFNETRFDKEELPRIIEMAKARLLRDNAAFSEDILRIEISSPDVPHLTLVDLPGFYHAEDENQSAEGRKIVDRLVETYMERKNSIILAIVSARNQVIMQKVLSKVKAHDKNQERTLGIITKPDLLIPGSQDEDKFIKLARNQELSHRLALGWHVLRNRSEMEGSLTPQERDSKEREFFDSGIWSAIPSNNRGVNTLRKKLANILLDHIRQNLDTLIKNIEENLDNRRKKLQRLGSPRSSPAQLRAHLDKIASQFQLLSLRAIEGNYSDEFFGGLYPDDMSASMDDGRIRKLRALVRDLNRTFAYILSTKGSRRVILADDADAQDSDDGNLTGEEASLPSFLHVLATQYPFRTPEKVSRDTIKAELEPLSSANQGTEFPGTTNDLIAVKLFQDQSRPWEAIARFHIGFILRIVKSFTEKLVTHITGLDQTTCSAILLNVVDPFFEERTPMLENKLQELLCHFRSGYPQPSDAEFRQALTRRRQKQLTAELLQNLLASRPELFTEKGKQQLAGLGVSARKSEFGVDGLIDKSETYYELSLRNFTDNVIILAIENCLIKDLPTIITTGAVSRMENKILERLAAESTDIRVERAELEGECEALQKGLDLCKTYRSRNSTVLPPILLSLRDNSSSTNLSITAGKSPFSKSAQKTQGSILPASLNGAGATPSKSPSPSAIGATSNEASSLPTGGPQSSTNGAASKNPYPKPGLFGTGQTSSSTPGPFGSGPTGATGSAFGSGNTTSSIFGSGNLGTATKPAFGSGSTAATATTGTTFGSTGSGSGLFANPAPRTSGSGLFPTATSTPNPPSGGGLFGNLSNTTPNKNGTTGPGLFGNLKK